MTLQLPRAGLLRFPEAGRPRPPNRDEWPLAGVLAGRGIAPVSYAEWLRIETAEADLAQALGRGERVKLHNRDAIWSACRPERPLVLGRSRASAGMSLPVRIMVPKAGRPRWMMERQAE